MKPNGLRKKTFNSSHPLKNKVRKIYRITKKHSKLGSIPIFSLLLQGKVALHYPPALFYCYALKMRYYKKLKRKIMELIVDYLVF